MRRFAGWFFFGAARAQAKTPVFAGSDVDLRNRLVNFRICDIYYPDPRDLLKAVYGENVLQGRVCDLTTGGTNGEAYLVVMVEGLAEPTIVPKRAILGVL